MFDKSPFLQYDVIREVMEMSISVRVNKIEEQLIRSYAEINGRTVSDIVRSAILDKIEDEYDLRAYEKAKKEYLKNPATYSHEEVVRMLGTE